MMTSSNGNIYLPFVRGIHRSLVNSPHKGQWRGALMFSLICAWINGWANNREACDLARHCANYGAIAMNRDADIYDAFSLKISVDSTPRILLSRIGTRRWHNHDRRRCFVYLNDNALVVMYHYYMINLVQQAGSFFTNRDSITMTS